MKKGNFDSIVRSRLKASNFAQPAKRPLHLIIWRKLCAAKIV